MNLQGNLEFDVLADFDFADTDVFVFCFDDIEEKGTPF